MDTFRKSSIIEIVVVLILTVLLCVVAYLLLKGTCLDLSLEKAYIEDTIPPLGQ